jgi:hypothetical protein
MSYDMTPFDFDLLDEHSVYPDIATLPVLNTELNDALVSSAVLIRTTLNVALTVDAPSSFPSFRSFKLLRLHYCARQHPHHAHLLPDDLCA